MHLLACGGFLACGRPNKLWKIRSPHPVVYSFLTISMAWRLDVADMLRTLLDCRKSRKSYDDNQDSLVKEHANATETVQDTAVDTAPSGIHDVPQADVGGYPEYVATGSAPPGSKSSSRSARKASLAVKVVLTTSANEISPPLPTDNSPQEVKGNSVTDIKEAYFHRFEQYNATRYMEYISTLPRFSLTCFPAPERRLSTAVCPRFGGLFAVFFCRNLKSKVLRSFHVFLYWMGLLFAALWTTILSRYRCLRIWRKIIPNSSKSEFSNATCLV